MDLHYLIKKAEKALRDNSPTILTSFGVSGTLTTAYLASKASFKASEIIRQHDVTRPLNRKDLFKERFGLVWKLYIPAAISGAVTIGCIIGAAKIGNRRMAAVTAAYSLSEKAFTEYKDKVTEKFGKNKEQSVRDEIAQDKVKQNAPSSQQILMAGPGNVLCCELYTGRYFTSDIESLRKAQNEINAKIVREVYATLNDFYYIIGLSQTSYSGDIGWDSYKLMELEFSTVLTNDGKPCLAFEYNYVKPID